METPSIPLQKQHNPQEIYLGNLLHAYLLQGHLVSFGAIMKKTLPILMDRFYVNLSFHFSGISVQEYNCWSYGSCIFSVLVFFGFFFMKMSNYFLCGYNILHFHQNVRVNQFLPIFPALVIVNIFRLSHSDRCVVITHLLLICITLVADDVQHLFMCLFATSVSSIKCHFMSSSFSN